MLMADHRTRWQSPGISLSGGAFSERQAGDRYFEQFRYGQPSYRSHQVSYRGPYVWTAAHRLGYEVRVDSMKRLAHQPKPNFCRMRKQWKADRKLEQVLYLPRPRNPPLPALTLDRYAGVYSNLAYGQLELCAVLPTKSQLEQPSVQSAFHEHISSNTQSQPCKALLSAAPRQLPGVLSPSDESIPTLLAEFQSTWPTHLKLAHYSNGLFNVTAYTALDLSSARSETTINGSFRAIPVPGDDEPFDIVLRVGGFSVEFDVVSSENATGEEGRVRGIAMTGMWGSGEDVPKPVGETVEQRAEVYFDRVRA